MKKIILVLLVLLGFGVSAFAERTYGHYFAPKWMPPITKETSCGWAFSLEYGHLFKSGFFWGVEVTGGVDDRVRPKKENLGYYYDDDEGDLFPNLIGGATFNLGYIIELPYEFQIAFGGSIGPWVATWEEYKKDTNTDYYGNKYTNDYLDEGVKLGIGGPFVKFRWHFAEVTYRGIMGMKNDFSKDEIGFGYISQLMLGFNFAFDMRR